MTDHRIRGGGIAPGRTIARAAGAAMLVCVASAPLLGQARAPRAADAWWGEDKVRHLGASAAATAIGYGAARVVLERDGAAAVALGSAALAGLLREVHDHRLGKPFSVRDLAWDALGIAAGYLWIREIE